jgi:hypothetical protein
MSKLKKEVKGVWMGRGIFGKYLIFSQTSGIMRVVYNI